MALICLFALFLASADSLKMYQDPSTPVTLANTLKPHAEGMTLRKWMLAQPCINMASQPLMNTQFAQLGAIDALDSEGLMDKITGMSGVSSGAFITALAAMKNRSLASSNFRSLWPGWASFGATDPEFSQQYKAQVLDKVLPATFEELTIPLAVSAVYYHTEKAAADVDYKEADPFVVSDGPLAESVLVSSSAMMGAGCPKCENGFQAKNFRGLYPVADGFLKDEYGTLGLHALAPCENLVHIVPQNLPQQLAPTPNANLDTQPKSVVSLGVDVPTSAIMSMTWNLFNATDKASMTPKDWDKVEYETAYQHMKEQLDAPMMVGEEPNHFFVDLKLIEHWGSMRGQWELDWDKKFIAEHTKYWPRTADRRNEMTAERNKKIAEGQLSYRPGGNGIGAPKLK